MIYVTADRPIHAATGDYAVGAGHTLVLGVRGSHAQTQADGGQ